MEDLCKYHQDAIDFFSKKKSFYFILSKLRNDTYFFKSRKIYSSEFQVMKKRRRAMKRNDNYQKLLDDLENYLYKIDSVILIEFILNDSSFLFYFNPRMDRLIGWHENIFINKSKILSLNSEYESKMLSLIKYEKYRKWQPNI